MELLFIFSILFMLLSTFFYYTHFIKQQSIQYNQKQIPAEFSDWKFYFILILITAFLIRIFLSTCFYERDVTTFMSWLNTLTYDGLHSFYQTYHCVYPPLYAYFLWILGHILQIFGITLTEVTVYSLIIMKLPAILFDLFTGVLLFFYTKNYFSIKQGLVIFLLYIMNPAIIINSTFWGQVDSLYTFMILLMCYYIMKKKLKQSYFAFALALLLKYQALIFAPVLLCAILDQVILHNFTWKRFWNHLFTGISIILLILIAFLPFLYQPHTKQFSFTTMFSSVSNTLSAFPTASASAYNLWNLLGLKGVSQEIIVLFLPARIWGSIAIVLLVLLTLYLHNKQKNNILIYPLIAVILIHGMFLFSVRMHERYLFPAISLALLGLPKQRKQQISFFFCYIINSVLLFLNEGFILIGGIFGASPISIPLTKCISVGFLFTFFFFFYQIWNLTLDEFTS